MLKLMTIQFYLMSILLVMMGERYNNICPHCHECLTKTYIDEGVGKQLFEVTECPNCGKL